MSRNRNNLALAWLLAALAYLTVTLLAGLLYSLQFIQLYPFAEMQTFSPARWRIVHSQGVIWGFVMSAFVGGLHWLLPRWSERPSLSRVLGWIVFGAWQAAVAAGLVLAVRGCLQPVRWNELSIVPDAIMAAVLALLATDVLRPLLDARRRGAPGAGCVMVGLVLAAPVHVLGNLVAQEVGGPAGTALATCAGAAMPGLVLTLLGWGLATGLATAIADRPPWKPQWLSAAVPLLVILYLVRGALVVSGGTGFFVSSATTFTGIAVGFISLSMAFNLGLTLWQPRRAEASSLPVRWLLAGTACYALASFQSVVQEIPPIADFVRFTDWQIAHSHLLVFGAFGLWSLGAIVAIVPGLLSATEWRRASWSEYHLWLSMVGILVMWAVLAVVGPFQAFLWRDRVEWSESIVASSPAWLCRTLAGGMIILGQVLLLANLIATLRARAGRLQGAGVGLAIAATIVIATFAAARSVPSDRAGEDVMTIGSGLAGDATPLPHDYVALAEAFPARFGLRLGGRDAGGPAAALNAGRAVYVREGCWQCHTQQIRPTNGDAFRWGPFSESLDRGVVCDTLPVPGSRRVGPDLARETGRRTNDWHLAHLYDPPGPTPVSVMPRYPWLFNGQGEPTEQGLAVTAYLQWLGTTPAPFLSSHSESR